MVEWEIRVSVKRRARNPKQKEKELMSNRAPLSLMPSPTELVYLLFLFLFSFLFGLDCIVKKWFLFAVAVAVANRSASLFWRLSHASSKTCLWSGWFVITILFFFVSLPTSPLRCPSSFPFTLSVSISFARFYLTDAFWTCLHLFWLLSFYVYAYFIRIDIHSLLFSHFLFGSACVIVSFNVSTQQILDFKIASILCFTRYKK